MRSAFRIVLVTTRTLQFNLAPSCNSMCISNNTLKCCIGIRHATPYRMAGVFEIKV